MSARPPAAIAGWVAWDYHGRPTKRLESDTLRVEVLAEAGPRIVRLGFAGSSENLLAETPDIGWQTPLGRYELFGGHRLWFAPEDPERVAVPDSRGLAPLRIYQHRGSESLLRSWRGVGTIQPRIWSQKQVGTCRRSRSPLTIECRLLARSPSVVHAELSRLPSPLTDLPPPRAACSRRRIRRRPRR